MIGPTHYRLYLETIVIFNKTLFPNHHWHFPPSVDNLWTLLDSEIGNKRMGGWGKTTWDKGMLNKSELTNTWNWRAEVRWFEPPPKKKHVLLLGGFEVRFFIKLCWPTAIGNIWAEVPHLRQQWRLCVIIYNFCVRPRDTRTQIVFTRTVTAVVRVDLKGRGIESRG